jgi:selT/selW/selH-like putative selenoprotein
VKAWLEARGHGPVTIEPGRSGQFDVSIDGRLVYSKAETGRFPSADDLEALKT